MLFSKEASEKLCSQVQNLKDQSPSNYDLFDFIYTTIIVKYFYKLFNYFLNLLFLNNIF